MKSLKKVDWHFVWLIFVTIVLIICYRSIGWAKEARTVRLNDKRTAQIYISQGRSTILNFPVKPTKVILGNKGLFGLEYVENDLALTTLSLNARSNLFVYLAGRRFAFDLIAVSHIGDEIVLVRDESEQKIPFKVK